VAERAGKKEAGSTRAQGPIDGAVRKNRESRRMRGEIRGSSSKTNRRRGRAGTGSRERSRNRKGRKIPGRKRNKERFGVRGKRGQKNRGGMGGGKRKKRGFRLKTKAKRKSNRGNREIRTKTTVIEG
jgi:hypothetical protein